jgi:recombination protein RecA
VGFSEINVRYTGLYFFISGVCRLSRPFVHAYCLVYYLADCLNGIANAFSGLGHPIFLCDNRSDNNVEHNNHRETQMDDNKKKALAAALSQIEKQFGKGSVMRMGDDGALPGVETVSTGSLALDIALGIGGLPRGRVTEIYGPESSGKTTLTLHVIAEMQKVGGTAAFIDAEHALDPSYAEKLGVNIDDLLISQPDNGEQALEITDMLVRSGAVDIVVIDSVAALTPKAEIEGDMGDSHMGLQARLMSQALRKLTANIKRSNTMVIFINQIRMKIGVMFGSPETTTGGNALKFYASVRLDIRRIGAIKKGDEIVGNETKVKVAKNKVAPPFKLAFFEILYGEGISREGELITMGVEHNIIDKAGAWYSYNGDRIGQGKERVRDFLKDNPDIANDIEQKLRDLLVVKPKEASEDEVMAKSEQQEPALEEA